MAIDARCTFCNKTYRLKEDLAGKKVTCANQECRKVFHVVPLDADTIAAAALSDEPAVQVPVESRTIPMSCVICEHKWAIAWDMQGKNVLCPDCKHRQKVPEQKVVKAADWRTGGGGPSLAKRETLENVTSARDTSMVSGDTLLKTGVIDDGVEPVPIKVKLMRWSAAAIALAALIYGGYYFFWSRPGSKSIDREAGRIKEYAEAEEFKTLPLHRSILHMAAGKYMARTNTPKGLADAVTLLGAAYEDLDKAPRSLDRDCLIVELAFAMLDLGGQGDELKDRRRIPWTPQMESGARPSIQTSRAEQEGVHGQVGRAFGLLQKNGADAEFRTWAARRFARELISRGQLEVLNLGAFFNETELPEMQAQIALEQYRAGRVDDARAVAESLKEFPTPSPAIQTLLALFEFKPLPSMSDSNRLAVTAHALVKKDAAGALAAVQAKGTWESRLRAAALAAEWADEPAQFLTEADKVATEVIALMKTDTNVMLPPVLTARLARAAAKAGDAEHAEGFTKKIFDAPLRAFMTADVLNVKLKQKQGETVADDAAELPKNPEDPKEFLAGHAWGRYCLARHNGFTGGAGLAAKLRESWPKPLVAPFGAAGAMLGLQDQSVTR